MTIFDTTNFGPDSRSLDDLPIILSMTKEAAEHLTYTLDDIKWMSAQSCFVAYVGNFLILSPVVAVMVPDENQWLWEVRKLNGDVANDVTHFGVHQSKAQTQDMIERCLMELA